MDANDPKNQSAIADLLFIDETKTPQAYEMAYPPRLREDGSALTVARFAPSPTGFVHLGGLYTTMVNRMFTIARDGVLVLRIEDTDQKRLVENGVDEIVDTLAAFGLACDEGARSAKGETGEVGDYGPYRQSQRGQIYRTYARDLVRRGDAYPCFCTEETLAAIHAEQSAQKSDLLGYGEGWARCRNMPPSEALARIREGNSFVIRLRSKGHQGNMRTYRDGLRGEISMQENNQDIVLIKSDGLPTYHFAHAIDDHLMRTTDVIRADEWIPSLPIHFELFETLGFQTPNYYHLSPLMKTEGTSRRKLSKRKDPEARAAYFTDAGYPPQAVLEYLMFIASSSFEDWRRDNPESPMEAFPFEIEKSSVSGALFDFDKLSNISRRHIEKMGEAEILAALEAYCFPSDASIAARPESSALGRLIREDPDRFLSSVPIWHAGRLDVEKWSDLIELYPYLYDPDFAHSPAGIPEQILAKSDEAIAIVERYIETFDSSDSSEEWFGKLQAIAQERNYAVKTKDYKKNPQDYAGSIADLTGYVRFALTGRLNTPDLYSIARYIGGEAMTDRAKGFCEVLRQAQKG